MHPRLRLSRVERHHKVLTLFLGRFTPYIWTIFGKRVEQRNWHEDTDKKIQGYYLEFLCFERKLWYDEKIKTQKKRCGEKIEEISHCSQGNNIWLVNNDGAAFLQSMQWMLRNFSATKIRVHKFFMRRICLAAEERKSKWPIINATLWKDWRTLRAWRDSFNLSSNLQQAYYCSLADNA